MTQPEETPVSFIPSNFIEKGKILNGTFDMTMRMNLLRMFSTPF